MDPLNGLQAAVLTGGAAILDNILTALDTLAEGASTPVDYGALPQTGSVPNVAVGSTPDAMQSALESNGYTVQSQGMSSNGAYTVLTNGQNTYTIYTATSTGGTTVEVFGPGGQSLVKYRLSGK